MTVTNQPKALVHVRPVEDTGSGASLPPEDTVAVPGVLDTLENDIPTHATTPLQATRATFFAHRQSDTDPDRDGCRLNRHENDGWTWLGGGWWLGERSAVRLEPAVRA
ncbi:hypothetical protein ABZ897_57820 [Nonomuraea sp. NPDC046802]|uniref:hypothetical protein n=1 Tax=Nonomuraea sp. NPDC046802 TaxID=3154919 RepID=UPI0033F163A0